MPIIDPPSARVRRDGSTPRRRTPDASTRRRKEDHTPGNSLFGALLTVVVAVMFLGYVFNIGGFATSADAFFRSLNTSAQSQNDAVVRVMSLVYPALGLLVAAIVVFAILRMLLNGIKTSSKHRKLADRAVVTLEEFKRLTAVRGIRPRIATQAYQLLLPHYSSGMRARLEDRLREDLHLTAVQVQDVYGNLLRNSDRKPNVGETPTLVTVMDLLNAAQNAKRHSLMDSMVRPVARLSGVVRSQRTIARSHDKAPQ